MYLLEKSFRNNDLAICHESSDTSPLPCDSLCSFPGSHMKHGPSGLAGPW
ncbi:hypothetical protein EMIT0196P_90234 [Pseudomonas chlororaphis]